MIFALTFSFPLGILEKHRSLEIRLLNMTLMLQDGQQLKKVVQQLKNKKKKRSSLTIELIVPPNLMAKLL